MLFTLFLIGLLTPFSYAEEWYVHTSHVEVVSCSSDDDVCYVYISDLIGEDGCSRSYFIWDYEDNESESESDDKILAILLYAQSSSKEVNFGVDGDCEKEEPTFEYVQLSE